MKHNKSLKLILEQIEKDPLLAGSNDSDKHHLMQAVASGLVHVVQMVAHKVAGKYYPLDLSDEISSDQEEKYMDLIDDFMKVVADKLHTGEVIPPKEVNTKMISDEFDKVISDVKSDLN